MIAREQGAQAVTGVWCFDLRDRPAYPEEQVAPLLRYEVARGELVLGSREEWVAFRLRAMREWRDEEPRFRRLAQAHLRRFLQEQAASPGAGK